MFFKKAIKILEENPDFESLRKKFSYVIVTTRENFGDIKGYSCVKKNTPVIFFEGKKIDVIFMGFSKNTRNEIRKTFNENRLSFGVASSGSNDFNECYSIYKKQEYKQNRVPNSKVFFKDCLFFFAKYDEKIVSCISVLVLPNTICLVRTISSGRLDSNLDLKKVIGYSSRRIVYEICEYCINNGLKELDLAYVPTNPSKNRGIYAFKMSFGPDLIDEYRYMHFGGVVKIMKWIIFMKNRAKFMLNKSK